MSLGSAAVLATALTLVLSPRGKGEGEGSQEMGTVPTKSDYWLLRCAGFRLRHNSPTVCAIRFNST